jgi:hypothetical protein
VEEIKKILSKIELPFEDFCPCDYMEKDGEGILIIKRHIIDTIAEVIAKRK